MQIPRGDMKQNVKSKSVSYSVMSDSVTPWTRLLCPWHSLDKNTEVGCHAFPQGIFPIPRLNPGSPALQADSLPFEPPGKQNRHSKTSSTSKPEALGDLQKPYIWGFLSQRLWFRNSGTGPSNQHRMIRMHHQV